MKGEARMGVWTAAAVDPSTGLYRVGEVPMYSVDAMCRRADALQATVHAQTDYLGLNATDAKSLGLDEGHMAVVSQAGGRAELPVRIMDSLPAGAAWLPGARPAGVELGALVGPLSVEKA